MKKSIKILSVIALVGMALSFSSCTKCVTCQVTDPSGNVGFDEEVCSDVDDNIEHGQNQSLCEADALLTPGDTCLCSTTSYGASIW